MKHSKAKQVISRGQKILLEKGWCKGTFARDAAGNTTCAGAADAVSFCLTGALERARLETHASHEDLRRAIAAIREKTPCHLPDFNDDSRNKFAVLDVMEQAKEAL